MPGASPEPSPEKKDTPGSSLTSEAPQPHPPLIPDHEMLRRIGRGSYGEVWLARSVMGAYRAVKIVHRNSFEDIRPFERELAGIQRFEPISRLDPSQVDILHVGRNETCFYYVMELADDQVTGRQIDPGHYTPRTLRNDLARQGRLPLERCLEIALSLTNALAHLHDHGLVHRDIKPSNIIFVDGVPKLADIGLVTGVNATRSYVGTEGYIPPEGPGTPGADLYSLGKVLYEISTGKDRQDFPEPPTFWDATPGPQPWLEFQEILLKVCETDPQRRYRSAREMRADLELLQSGKSVKRLRALERRLKLLTRAGFIAGSLLVLSAAAWVFTEHEARQAKLQAARADREAARAKSAEEAARDKLWDSYLAQAQARRWSGRVGRRFESLEALRKAAEIRPSVELRNEAIACMALSDLRAIKEWDGNPPGTTLIAFDSSYERYARAGAGGSISVRRVADDQEILSLPGAGVIIESALGFSPNGELLAALYGTNDLQLRVWKLASREIFLQTEGIKCRTFDFSSDGRFVALAQRRGPILIYDLATGQVTKSLAQELNPYSLRFDPQTRRLAVSSARSYAVDIRDLTNGTVIQSLSHSNIVRGISWSPDGSLLAAACGDWNVYVWDVQAGRIRSVFSGHQASVVNVAFSDHGELLQSDAWDGTLRLWDVAKGLPLLSISTRGGLAAFPAHDRRLAYLGDGSRLNLCEVARAGEYQSLHLDGQAAARSSSGDYSPDGQWLTSIHRDGGRLWNAMSKREVAFLPERDLACVAFTSDSRSLITSGNGGLKKWPIESMGEDGSVRLGAPKVFGSRAVLIEQFSLSRDGRRLAVCYGGVVYLFDPATREKKLELHGESPFYRVALSSNAGLVAAASNPQSLVRVWNATNGNSVQDLTVSKTTHLAFSPDNQWLVIGSNDAYRFWSTRTWQCVHSVSRREGGDLICHVAFAPNGRMAAILYSARSIRLVDLPSGQELATWEMPDAQVIVWLCFSPDGHHLAVGGQTPVVHFWDLRLIRQQLARMNLDWE